jgi:hypothetical protein
MNPTLKLHLLRYWAAMTASAFQSGIHAVVGFGGLASVHAVSDSIPALTLQQGGWLFLTAFGRELLNWLDKHPILAALSVPDNNQQPNKTS